jgi:hypothetical protein
MAEKELNLFQLPAIDMAQFCAGSPKIVWSEMVQLHSLSATSNDVPDDIFGNPVTPRRPMAAHRSENSARRYLRQISPSIDCLLDPSRHRNRTDMTAIANQVYDGPVSLPDLQILNSKSRELGPAQSAAYEHGNHCEITDTAQIVAVGFLQQQSRLILGQPVSGVGPQLLYAFDPANACNELRTE